MKKSKLVRVLKGHGARIRKLENASARSEDKPEPIRSAWVFHRGQRIEIPPPPWWVEKEQGESDPDDCNRAHADLYSANLELDGLRKARQDLLQDIHDAEERRGDDMERLKKALLLPADADDWEKVMDAAVECIENVTNEQRQGNIKISRRNAPLNEKERKKLDEFMGMQLGRGMPDDGAFVLGPDECITFNPYWRERLSGDAPVEK